MIIVDVEATGPEFSKHSLLSIGAVDFDNPTNQFYGECRAWDGAHMNMDGLNVNGFTVEQATDIKKQTDGELVKAFIDWSMKVPNHTLAGQNPSFDRDFIKDSAQRAGLDWPFAYRTIDQHTICYMHMIKRGIKPPVLNGRTDLNSDKIMEYVGIPAEVHPHNALNGAKIEAEAMSRLLYDKKLIAEFESYEVPWLREDQKL